MTAHDGIYLQEPVEVETLWAGHRLRAKRGTDRPVGTLWTVSRHPNAPTTVKGGPEDGRKLADLVRDDEPSTLGGHAMLHGGYIDADQYLSVQVHPQDAYAREHEGDNGKTETWYIIQCEPGAKLVAGTSAQSLDELRRKSLDGTVEDLLVHREVAPGDVVHVPSGTLHCIGAGIFCAEISQDSDVTYRFYDYDRTDAQGRKRELHLDKSLDVVRLDQGPVIAHCGEPGGNQVRRVVEGGPYDVLVIDVDGELVYDHGDRPAALLAVDGSGSASWDGGTVELGELGSAFVSAGCGPVTLRGRMRLFAGEGR